MLRLPLILASVAAGIAAGAACGQTADLILTDGRFVTLDSAETTAAALAIGDGRILAVGSRDTVMRHRGPETRVAALGGRMVIPGLIETHCHAIGVATDALGEPYQELRSIAAVQRWIRQRARELPAGRWIRVPRTDVMRLDEMRFPTVQELDASGDEHPVVFTSVRKHVLNTAAWRALGGAAEIEAVPDATIVRDNAGRPWMLSGSHPVLREQTAVPEYSEEQKLRSLRQVHQIYNSVGITSIFERALNQDGWRLYQQLRDREQLSVRVTGTIRQQFRSAEQVEVFSEDLGLRTGDGDDWLRVGPLKITVDGGIHWGSTRLREPFGPRRRRFYRIETLVPEDYRGDLRYSVDRMTDVFATAHRLGWQLCVHVTGDAGVDRVLDALERADSEVPLRDRRFTLTHAYFPAADAIDRCRELGVCVDTQPYLYFRDARFIDRVYGPTWASRFIGLNAWLRGGVPLAINSDHMIGTDPDRAMNSFNPFLQLAIAVTRRDTYGDVYGAEQRLSRMQALRCMTTSAAWLAFDEDRKGTLEVGRLADLVVLDRDYFTCPEDEIREIRPLLTMVGGRVVSRKEGLLPDLP